MTAIKERKALRKIILYEWDPIVTEIEIKDITNMLWSEWRFITIWDAIVNKSNIRHVMTYEIDGMEQAILSQPKSVQRELREILTERKAKHNKTTWFKHLRRIYESRKDLKRVEE